MAGPGEPGRSSYVWYTEFADYREVSRREMSELRQYVSTTAADLKREIAGGVRAMQAQHDDLVHEARTTEEKRENELVTRKSLRYAIWAAVVAGGIGSVGSVLSAILLVVKHAA